MEQILKGHQSYMIRLKQRQRKWKQEDDP